MPSVQARAGDIVVVAPGIWELHKTVEVASGVTIVAAAHVWHPSILAPTVLSGRIFLREGTVHSVPTSRVQPLHHNAAKGPASKTEDLLQAAMNRTGVAQGCRSVLLFLFLQAYES